MKPNEAEIQWCLANRELVMRWLERRGWWQDGDWYKDRHYDEACVLVPGGDVPLGSVWLPTSDDAREILENLAGPTWKLDWNLQSMHYIDGRPSDYGTELFNFRGKRAWRANGPTPLIALMELLKSVEEKDDPK